MEIDANFSFVASNPGYPYTMTAYTPDGEVATHYTGEKMITFSGTTGSGMDPAVTSAQGAPVPFGTSEDIEFVKGVARTTLARLQMVLVVKKTGELTMQATDGSISTCEALAITLGGAGPVAHLYG